MSIIEKKVHPDTDSTPCALCRCPIHSGDNVFIVKIGFCTENDFFCSEKCARAVVESNMAFRFSSLEPHEIALIESEGLFTAYELEQIKNSQMVPPSLLEVCPCQ